MKKSEINEIIRSSFMSFICEKLEEKGETVLQVKNNTFSIPWVFEEEEGYLNLTFSIPKGERNGSSYDGFEEAENFNFEKAKKAETTRDCRQGCTGCGMMKICRKEASV